MEAFIGWVFIMAFFWSLGLFLFSLMSTVKACMGNYPMAAVALYWLTTGLSFILIIHCGDMVGLKFFVWSSPVLTIIMNAMENHRKRTLNNRRHESNN